jgi:hypothetical protein
VQLVGLSFIVMMQRRSAMGTGNMDRGLIIDERAGDAQVEAISAIATGAVGGPMARWLARSPTSNAGRSSSTWTA